MKKLTNYDVFLDCGSDCMKVSVPALSVSEAKKYCSGNGDFIGVRLSNLQDIDTDCLTDTLRKAEWGKAEIDLIVRALEYVGLERA